MASSLSSAPSCSPPATSCVSDSPSDKALFSLASSPIVYMLACLSTSRMASRIDLLSSELGSSLFLLKMEGFLFDLKGFSTRA